MVVTKDVKKEYLCYKLLGEVYGEGGYSNIVLGNGLKTVAESDKPFVTRLFYGVLENDIQFDYIISKLTDKKPKTSVSLVIKIGLYLLRYSDVPNYAAINKTVELCKKVGKPALCGFVNAILRKSQEIVIDENLRDETSISLITNYPIWIVKKLCHRYGNEFTFDMLKSSRRELTHIRHNSLNVAREDMDKLLPYAQKTITGYYVDSRYLALRSSLYVVQSLASTLAVNFCASLSTPNTFLDTCAAPGGKSVYFYELTKAKITACDIHAHRVDLIKKYAKSVGAKINALQNDATIFREEWTENFDTVMCDVPCSGSGVIGSKPDIARQLREESLFELTATQLKILKTSALYVKKGGYLVYSTCSVLKEENENICEQFLKENSQFVPAEFNYAGKYSGSMINLYPHIDGCDGFFVAGFKRV